MATKKSATKKKPAVPKADPKVTKRERDWLYKAESRIAHVASDFNSVAIDSYFDDAEHALSKAGPRYKPFLDSVKKARRALEAALDEVDACREDVEDFIMSRGL